MAALIIFSFKWPNFCSKWKRILWLAAIAVPFLTESKVSAQPASSEYQIKAVFLFNFAQFVEWPVEAFSDQQSPLIIGVLGDDPFGRVLDDTVQGEKIGERSLLIRRFRRVQDIDACHILFISKSETSRLEAVVAALANRKILTVSDADRAAHRGVMIRFMVENKKIRLRVNLDAAKLAELTISSKLLRPAEIVTTKHD